MQAARRHTDETHSQAGIVRKAWNPVFQGRIHCGQRREKEGKMSAEEAPAGHTEGRQGCRTGRNLTEDGEGRSIPARHNDRKENTAIKNYPI